MASANGTSRKNPCVGRFPLYLLAAPSFGYQDDDSIAHSHDDYGAV